jgi:hypothetical protein
MRFFQHPLPRILKKRKASTHIEEWEDTFTGCIKQTCGLHLEHVPPVEEPQFVVHLTSPSAAQSISLKISVIMQQQMEVPL